MATLPRRLYAILPCLVLAGCFEDPMPDPPVGDSSETDGDGDGDPGDGDPGDGDPGDGDGDPTSPPQIDIFTINGGDPPSPIEAAGAISLEVVASDPDGDLTRVEFEADGQLVGSVSGSGPDFIFEWLLSGAELNGNYTVQATAYDASDNASETVELALGVAMPDGGSIVEQWSYDGGLLDAVYDVAVTPDGDQVVLVGQTTTMSGSGQRVDRVIGPAWTEKLEPDSLGASGVVWAQDAFIIAGSLWANQEINTALYTYDDAGALADEWIFDAAKLEMGNPEVWDTPTGLVQDSTGRLYVMGQYNPLSGPLMGMRASLLLAVSPTGDQEWVRWPTEDPNISGDVLLTELAISADDELVSVGNRAGELWMGRWNADGQLQSEYPLANAAAHAAAFAADGGLYIGGGLDSNGIVKSWIRKLDASDQELWSVQPTQGGLGATAGLAVDAWNEVVSVSTESCTSGNGSLTACELVVRKYSADGLLMWSTTWDMETFSGPVDNLPGLDASVTVDRFGYVYVTAIAYTNATGTDWWAAKLDP